MSDSMRERVVAVAAELGTISAGVLVLSFVYGYQKHKFFLDAIGLGWASVNILPMVYAMHAIDAFVAIVPMAILFYFMSKYSVSDALAKVHFRIGTALLFLFMCYALWVRMHDFSDDATFSSLFVERNFIAIGMILGVCFAVIFRVFNIPGISKILLFVSLSSSICISLMLLPRLVGEAEGILVRAVDGDTLPYVIINDVKWRMLDNQAGSALLIRYDGKQKPFAMYTSIEGKEIGYDYANEYVDPRRAFSAKSGDIK